MQRTPDGRRQRRISDGKGTEPRLWTGFPKAVKIQTPIMVAVHRGRLARSSHARNIAKLQKFDVQFEASHIIRSDLY